MTDELSPKLNRWFKRGHPAIDEALRVGNAEWLNAHGLTVRNVSLGQLCETYHDLGWAFAHAAVGWGASVVRDSPIQTIRHARDLALKDIGETVELRRRLLLSIEHERLRTLKWIDSRRDPPGAPVIPNGTVTSEEVEILRTLSKHGRLKADERSERLYHINGSASSHFRRKLSEMAKRGLLDAPAGRGPASTGYGITDSGRSAIPGI